MKGADARQPDLFGHDEAATEARDRALLDQLIAATRLYDTRAAFQELLAFTTRLREFAPFNAMLLHIQKPALTHAATAKDWHGRFGAVPKRDARPLLVLRAMGPVDFVFDILDVEGGRIPESAFVFPVLGGLTAEQLSGMMTCARVHGFAVEDFDKGDADAGYITLTARAQTRRARNRYLVKLNRNHTPATRFVTLAHELGHALLGHLGDDPGRGVRGRSRDQALAEVEAETVAWLVANRNGVTPRSESYLDAYKGAFADLDIYAIMRAANGVEHALGISAAGLWAEKARENRP